MTGSSHDPKKLGSNSKWPILTYFDQKWSTMVDDLILTKIRFFRFSMTFSDQASSDDGRELSWPQKAQFKRILRLIPQMFPFFNISKSRSYTLSQTTQYPSRTLKNSIAWVFGFKVVMARFYPCGRTVPTLLRIRARFFSGVENYGIEL